MTDAEFTDFRARLIPSYAADHVRLGDWNADEAEARAAHDTDTALPDGPRTAGMLVLAAENEGGEHVGNVWLSLGRWRPDNAWIYYIETDPGQRGKGYGRALLRAAEEQARQHGVRTMGLNVFGANTVARNLYESSGYQAMSLVMAKPLDGGDHADAGEDEHEDGRDSGDPR
jgi:ribosomal protein S18 acetylase RimI-like enzyme